MIKGNWKRIICFFKGHKVYRAPHQLKHSLPAEERFAYGCMRCHSHWRRRYCGRPLKRMYKVVSKDGSDARTV